MILATAMGMAVTITTLTIFYATSSDPIPWKSNKLFAVQLDNWDPDQAYAIPNEPPNQLTYQDTQALINNGKSVPMAAMFKVEVPTQVEVEEYSRPLSRSLVGRATTAGFFDLFEPPFLYGKPWRIQEDEDKAQVVVLSHETNLELFDGQNSVGKLLKVNGIEHRIIGVLDNWNPLPKFFDITGSYTSLYRMEKIYLPISTALELQLRFDGNVVCWKSMLPGLDNFLKSECVWIQFWVQLNSPQEISAFKIFLDAYVTEQKKLGRFPRPLNTRLSNVIEWINTRKLWTSPIPFDVRIQTLAAFIFLLVCLITTMGLLLAKFARNTTETTLRYALGANRKQLFHQHLIESGLIGMSSGVIALPLVALCLWGVRKLYEDHIYVAQFNWAMLLPSLLLTILSALFIGLFPVWWVCRGSLVTTLRTN